MDELSDEESKRLVARDVFRNFCLSHLLLRSFTNAPGKYVSLKDTIAGFKGILAGEYDYLPEQAFSMVGSIEEAIAKAENFKVIVPFVSIDKNE